MGATRSEAQVRDLGRYWLVGDRLIAKIMGGSEGPQSGDSGGGQQSGDGQGDSGGAGGEGGGEGQQQQGEGEGQQQPPEGQEGEPSKQRKADDSAQRPGEDRGAYRARMARRAAEERAENAERALEELRDKDRTETQRLEARAAKAEKRVGTLEPTVRRQAIQIAFLLASNGDGNKKKPVAWVDSQDALLLVERELADIKIGDDGDIDHDDVRAVVEDIAKRKPHLVRKEQKQPAEQQPSGGAVGSGQQPPKDRSFDELAKSYPALRTRAPR